MERPWVDEPDELYIDFKNFKGCLLRGPFGHWCGYLAIPSSHPWYNIEPEDCLVHWGITYSGSYLPDGRQKDQWWIGFDCAHADDLCPKWYDAGNLQKTCTYRDVHYALKELMSMAKQAQLVKEDTELPAFAT